MKNILMALFFSTSIAAVMETPVFSACQMASDVRIDSTDDIQKYDQVCEAQNVTIFADS